METNEQYLKRLLPLLKKPIPHSWRVQSYSKNKPVATVMAYIDQRDLMDVLDAYCEYGWQKKYEEVAGNLFCSIGINMPDGTTQWRSDCGVESNQDAEKGRASDAAKRAGVNWGVGRFLYDMKIQYVTTNAKKDAGNYPHCIDEQGKQIWDLTEYINNKNPNAPKAPVQVKEPTTEEKTSMMQGRLNPDLPDGLAYKIINAKTQEELKVIWEDNKDLQTVKKFTDAVTTKKKELLDKK
jgi:hypothetical protein